MTFLLGVLVGGLLGGLAGGLFVLKRYLRLSRVVNEFCDSHVYDPAKALSRRLGQS